MAERKVNYNGVELRGCKKTPTQSEIDAFVRDNQLILPEDYLRFLSRVNGGRTRAKSYVYPRWTNNDLWPEPIPVETRWMIPKPTSEQLRLLQALSEVKAFARQPPRVREFCYLGRGDFSLTSLLAGRKLSRAPDSTSLLPIAFSDENRPIWMSLAEQHFGVIFHYDEELNNRSVEGQPPSLDDYIDLKIADSFAAFVRGLFKGEIMLKPGFEPNAHHLRVLNKR